MNKKRTKILLIILLLVAGIFIGFYLFYLLNKPNILFPIINKTNYVIAKYRFWADNEDKCQRYQFGRPADDFLPKYVVQKGDSLFSISKKQLGDTSRIYELIELNKRKYDDNLSLENSFIEVGQKIILPPLNAKKTSGKISLASGKVNSKENNMITLFTNNPTGYWYNFRAKSDETIVFLNNIFLGDCVDIIYDNGYYDMQEIYQINFQ